MTRYCIVCTLAAAALAAFFMSTSASADGPACRSIDLILEQAQARSTDWRILRSLRGPEAVDFVAAYNALPPISQVGADEVVIVSAATQPRTRYLLFSLQACIVAYGRVPATILDHLLAPLGRDT